MKAIMIGITLLIYLLQHLIILFFYQSLSQSIMVSVSGIFFGLAYQTIEPHLNTST